MFRCIWFSIILFFSSLSLDAVLVRVDFVSVPGKKTITLYFDQHGLAEDQEQLIDFTQSVKTWTINNPSKELHILLETPPDLYKQQFGANVLSYITDTVKEVLRVQVEDIEIRCVSHAALFILQGSDDVHPKDIYRVGDCSCVLGKVTLSGVIEEYLQLESTLKKSYQQFDSDTKINEVFSYSMQKANDKYTELIHLIKTRNIELKQPLYSYVGSLGYDRCEELERVVTDMFCPLVDLHIFHRILMLKDSKRIVVIAGGMHAFSVRYLLQSIDGQLEASFGDLDDSILLAKHQLTIDPPKRTGDSCSIL